MGIVTGSVRLAVIAAVVLAGPAAAAAEPEVQEPADDTVTAAVTIRPGPTEVVSAADGPCSDVVFVHEVVDSLVLERAGGAEGDLTVAVAEAGPAVPGVDHELLPRSVTFPAGSHEVVVQVVALPAERATSVTLDVTVQPGEGYEVEGPTEARVSFLRPQDPDAPPTECGFGIAGGPDLVRETVVGQRPDPVVVEGMLIPMGHVPLEPDAYVVTVTGGALPDGLTLGSDGAFGGRATTPGSTEALIEACRAGSELDTCVTATLTVTVAAASPRDDDTEVLAEQLPVTGMRSDLLLLGIVQLLAGAALLTHTGHRARPRAGRAT